MAVERVALALTPWLGAPSPSWSGEHVLLTIQGGGPSKGGALCRGSPSRVSVTLSHGCPVASSLQELSLVVSPPAAGVNVSVQTLALGSRGGWPRGWSGAEARGSEHPLSAFTRVTSVIPNSPCKVGRAGGPLLMPHFWPVLRPRPLRPANAPTVGASTLSGQEPGVFCVGPTQPRQFRMNEAGPHVAVHRYLALGAVSQGVVSQAPGWRRPLRDPGRAWLRVRWGDAPALSSLRLPAGAPQGSAVSVVEIVAFGVQGVRCNKEAVGQMLHSPQTPLVGDTRPYNPYAGSPPPEGSLCRVRPCTW